MLSRFERAEFIRWFDSVQASRHYYPATPEVNCGYFSCDFCTKTGRELSYWKEKINARG